MGKCMSPLQSYLCRAKLIPSLGRYGVILDAGSSGTRLHIYKWLDSTRAQLKATPGEMKSLPKLMSKKEWIKKTKPGISTFGDRPSAVGKEHLKELLDFAVKFVPRSQLADTPIFLMATAGMRLMSAMKQSELLREICIYAATFPFALPNCDLHIQVIPGETEALYGWIATNYLLGGFDSPEGHAHGQGHHTYGFLDMGGASAQIAFVPNKTESESHSKDLKLLRMRTLNGEASEYKVFVATWLRFGVNEARARYVEALKGTIDFPEAMELLDPCIPSGLTLTISGEVTDLGTAASSGKPYIKGQGIFNECLRKTYPLLNKESPCEESPCLLNGMHAPAIDFSINHFVGVSEYWHTTYGVFNLSPDNKHYDFITYRTQVSQFCNQNWAEINEGVKSKKWGKKIDERVAMEVCFKASWLINVLHDGIGIPREGLEKTPVGYNGTKGVLEHAKGESFLDPFQAVDKIDGKEVSWTLGKMVLYAAGQIKPRSSTLSVGFGSNVPSGIPDDFQIAGSTYLNPSPGSGDIDDDESWAEATDDILKTASKPSVSSLVLVILILIFVCYIFRKRERRKRLYNKFETVIRRSRRSGSARRGVRSFFNTGKVFGRTSGNYERVLEEGDPSNELELRGTDPDENEYSDSSEGSRVARTSGLATPKLNVLNYSEGNLFDATSSYGGGVGPGLNSIGMPNAMNRSGLVVRTESRERLAPMHVAGRRSRTGSPTRGKSPLMTPLEEF
jgi:golgi apyrase